MTAIILAGGKASRMNGADKAFLRIGRQTAIGRQLGILKKIFREIIVVTNAPKRYRRLEGVKIISDIVPNLGPLGGIYSGLAAAGSFWSFAFACDTPFINSGLIRYMRKNTAGYDAVVPRAGGRYQPLFCIYSKECLAHIKRLFDKHELKISGLFSVVKVKEITEAEILRFAPPEKVFANINTPDDLARFAGRYADRPL